MRLALRSGAGAVRRRDGPQRLLCAAMLLLGVGAALGGAGKVGLPTLENTRWWLARLSQFPPGTAAKSLI